MNSSNLTVFEFEKQEVRFVGTADDPWWVAADVCELLGLDNVSMAVTGNPKTKNEGLDEDEKCIIKHDTLGGKQGILCINESGLYALIFKSRKPVAKRFKKWVTSVVLPQIRRTGSYSEKVVVPIDILQDLIHQLNPSELKAWLHLYEKSLSSPDGKVVLSSDSDIATAIGIQARTWYRAKKKFAELGLFHFEKPVRYLTLRDINQ